MGFPGKGSAGDDGDLLEGSSTYKLHLPAGIPAAAFWAVTIYNPADGTMPQTDQPFPGTNGLDKPQYNADDSIDLLFRPHETAGHQREKLDPGLAWKSIHGCAAAVWLRDGVFRSDLEGG
jgi:hypothetical protein